VASWSGSLTVADEGMCRVVDAGAPGRRAEDSDRRLDHGSSSTHRAKHAELSRETFLQKSPMNRG